MIRRSNMVPRILSTCPSAKPRWIKHLDYWGNDERGIYVDLSEFAHHIIEAKTSDPDHPEIPAFFELLETFLTEGDPDVQELATIGLIEDIQNIASHQQNGFIPFESYLGPNSRNAWRQVIQLWEGKSSLMDVLREE